MNVWIKRVCLLLAVIAVGKAWAAAYDQYVSAHDMPNPVLYLPGPPDSTMIMLNGDHARWIWGKSQRSTPRGEEASGDTKYGIVRTSAIYSNILGVNITEEGTPAIYRLMARAGATGAGGVSAMKHTYFRRRPFLVMNESTWGLYDSHDNLFNNSSYPSSHTACGWGTALALAEMAPHLQDTILRRGYSYGISRVITGAHWLSDVNAAFLCASAAISRARVSPDYQADLKAARQEYMQLKGISESELSTNAAPSALKILDAPAMPDSYFFYGEVAPYWQAKLLRDTDRGRQAAADADLSDDAILAGFAPCFDIAVSAATTPRIVSLMKNLKLMLGLHAASMKGHWFRPRPYVQLADATIVPGDEQEYFNDSSYPSGHAVIGWGLALALSEVMPQCQDAILKRGYDFGWSRVIAGYHYPGDVQAGWVMAACLMSKMHNEAYFNSMLEAAKQEYASVKAQQDTAATTMALSQSSFLPVPPDSTDVGFAGDFYRWIWGKHQRDTELGGLARNDVQGGIDRLCSIFGDVMGVDISESDAPAIYSFLDRAAQAGRNSAEALSVNAMRKRPFVLMNEEPWGFDGSQPQLTDTAHHPSVHAAMTWTAALAMAQMAPNKQDTILARALQCAGSEVIAGISWQSDVDEAMVGATLALTQLWADSEHQALLDAARSEYLQLTGLTEADLKVSYPSMVELLGVPAGVDDVHMASDIETYWQCKPLRSTERGALALADASLSDEYFASIYGDCLPRVNITEENTPAIFNFIKLIKFLLNSQATLMKGSAPSRKRPYRQYNETYPYGGEEWQLFPTSSWPSRHALVGWGLAMAMAQVAPECGEALLQRAHAYSEGRMITGFAYASDVRAAMIASQCYLNKLFNESVFKSLIDEAKLEYRQLSSVGDVNGDGSVTSVDITALYNWLLDGDGSHIVNGDQDGDGKITAADVTVVYNILLGN